MQFDILGYQVRPSSQFVMRVPLLSTDYVFSSWSAGGIYGELGHASIDDATDSVTSDPLLFEAIRLGSPQLAGFLSSRSAEDRLPRSDEKLRLTLRKYVTRMATRATPFGLFASLNVGCCAESTDLHVPAVASVLRFTTLNGDAIAKLCERLVTDPQMREGLNYR